MKQIPIRRGRIFVHPNGGCISVPGVMDLCVNCPCRAPGRDHSRAPRAAFSQGSPWVAGNQYKPSRHEICQCCADIKRGHIPPAHQPSSSIGQSVSATVAQQVRLHYCHDLHERGNQSQTPQNGMVVENMTIWR